MAGGGNLSKNSLLLCVYLLVLFLLARYRCDCLKNTGKLGPITPSQPPYHSRNPHLRHTAAWGCPSFWIAFCCCNKDHDQSNLMGKRIHWSYNSTSQCITEGNQHRTSRWDPRVRSWSKHGGTLLTGFPHMVYSLLSCITQDCLPKGDTPHSGLDPPTSIINQKCLQAYPMAPNWHYLFPHDSSLYQIDK